MAGETTISQEGLNHPDKPPNIVKVELGEGRTNEVAIPSINHLFIDIAQYNDQFSMGRIAARGLFSLIKFEDDEVEPAQSIQREGEHQQVTAAALSAIHQNTLAKIGLSLEPVHGGATFMALGQQASSGEMRINVSDGRRFVSFLHALQPDQVQETGLRPNLENLSGVLAQQVLTNYDLRQPSDEALQLFGNLGNMVVEYKRLGMGQAVERLETYLAHARQGDLREFITIERNGYLSEPGKNFGPADWQLDSTPKYLKARWDEAIAVLKASKANPKARQLYDQLHSHLLKCVKIARGGMRILEEQNSYSPEQRAEMAKVLEEEHMQLEDLMITG